MEVGMEDPCGSPVPTGFRLTSAVYEIAEYSKAEFYI